MVENTESAETEEQPLAEQLLTSGHVERTILNHMVGDDCERYTPTTVGGVLDDIAAVIKRGEYGNIGPQTAESGTVRQSTIRRTFMQLREKRLVQRVEELSESELQADRFDLGTPDGDPTDPTAYSRTSDDARVTDWVLTDDGGREIERLDARYAAELDELAARYGRPRGETTDRIDA